MEISVIVCTMNRPQDLTRFLGSLDCQTMFPDELIVADASSDKETKKILDKKMDDDPLYEIKYLHTKPGLTRQRNAGFMKAQGKYIYYFDDDVVLEPDFIRSFYRTFEKFSDIEPGGITGRITNVSTDAPMLEKLFKRCFFLTDTGQGRIKLSGLPEHRRGGNTAFVQIVSGCCMAFPKKVLDKFRFDENLKGYSYMEDVDFSRRLIQAGYKLFYQPEARIKHLSSTTQTSDLKKLKKMFMQHHVYLFKKNSEKDLPHWFGFLMSIMGVLLYNLILNRSPKAVAGLIQGLLDPLRPLHDGNE